VAVPAGESSDELEFVAAPVVPPEIAVASPAEVPLAEVPLAAPFVEPPDEPPVLVTPVGPPGLPAVAALAVPALGPVPEPPGPPVPPVDAAAAAAAVEDGGEELPAAGNCPPPDWSFWALFAAGLRAADLAAALLSAAAKSLPSAF
jgi:hypothetical protein